MVIRRNSRLGSTILAFDSFRELPSDLTEPTFLGSFFSIMAFCLCATLFFCEVSSFVSSDVRTQILMDRNQDKLLRLHFDVLFHDLPCKHLVVGVWDSFGSERLNITANVKKTRIDHQGRKILGANAKRGQRIGLAGLLNDKSAGGDGSNAPADSGSDSPSDYELLGHSAEDHVYTEAELLELDKARFSEQEMVEYDRDWSSRSQQLDKLNDNSFDSVIEAHDYTFLNFYAGWCHHCRQFAPIWDTFENHINGGVVTKEVEDVMSGRAEALEEMKRSQAASQMASVAASQLHAQVDADHARHAKEAEGKKTPETPEEQVRELQAKRADAMVAEMTKAYEVAKKHLGEVDADLEKQKAANGGVVPVKSGGVAALPGGGLADAQGRKINVRAIKINCVDFEETCQQEKIQAFPTIRLYRRSVSMTFGGGDSYAKAGGAVPLKQGSGGSTAGMAVQGANQGKHTNLKPYVSFDGPRDERNLWLFAKQEVERSWNKLHPLYKDGSDHNQGGGNVAGGGVTERPHFHNIFSEGCQIAGGIEVARVPGTLHFETVHAPSMSINMAFTNVSHTVNQFYIASGGSEVEIDANNGRYDIDTAAIRKRIPREYREHIGTLDKRSFITNAFHQAPHHYIQIVSTVFEGFGTGLVSTTHDYSGGGKDANSGNAVAAKLFGDRHLRSYQITHQHRTAAVAKNAIPQAKFSYSMSPVEVHVQAGAKPWYDFITSVLAIVGGCFTVMGLMQSSVSIMAKRTMKGSLGKLG